MKSEPRKEAGKEDHVKLPTVSRVTADTLIELVYDADARKTALVVSRFGGLWNIEQEVRIGTGETLIPYSAQNNLIASGCILLPSRPVEYGFKHELVGDIRAYLHRYVDLSPLFEQIASYYVLLSWVHERFSDLPYLRLRGDYGSGKTRGLIAIGSVCYKPIFASAVSTISPLFRIMDAFGGTLIYDEADLPYSDARADIVKLLNNGTTKGMPVLRTIENRHKELNPRAFKVFGPKVVAMRGAFDDRALESRFLTEETGQRPLRADIPIHLPDSFQTEALELRNRLLHYRLCHFYEIKADSAALTQGIEPRLNQTALSLLSLVDDLALRAEMQAVLVRLSDDLASDRRETPEARILAALCEAFSEASRPEVSIKQIADRFNAAYRTDYGMPVSNKWIGNLLRNRLHLSTRKSNGIFVVPVSERAKAEALAAKLGILVHDAPSAAD
jgi:hypothetical protein